MTAKFTADEKHREAMREVGQRRRVYSRLVEKGSLTREKAEWQTAIMQEIADDYAERAKAERLI